ncbi:MAG: hypothetical protein JWN41_870 [Thermoleophilia bacterium]|nr:hypothetical protein [Thermoleophilia bacterium]
MGESGNIAIRAGRKCGSGAPWRRKGRCVALDFPRRTPVIARRSPLARAPKVLLVAAIALLCIGVGSASATSALRVGIEQNGGMNEPVARAAILDTQHGLGAGVIRFQLRFDQVAKCDPASAARTAPVTSYANTCYDFSVPDAVVQGAHQRGMDVLLSIYGVPSWEFGKNFNWTGQTDADFNNFASDLAAFARAAATRYDGAHGMPRVGEWTIWNEPNGGYFFEPRFDSNHNLIGPQRYARMYDAAARNIKAVDPALLVAVGPTAPMPRDLPPLTWARAALPVLQALGSPIDAWAHNGYMGSQAPFSTTLTDPVVGLGNIGDLTTLIDQFPITARKPIWVTEFGYQTPPSAQSAVPPATQSALLGEAFYFAWSNPRITTIIWYSLSDDGGAENPGAFQAGLYYVSGRCGAAVCPKPAARNFQHTIYVAPVKANKVFVWGEGRLAPAQTRIFVQRAGSTEWHAYANRDTATTGAAGVTLPFTPGMQVMVCDVSCGELRTVSGTLTVAGGGGSGAKAKLVRLPLQRLDMSPSLKYGILNSFNCSSCKISATVLAKGYGSHIAAARKRAVVTARGKVIKLGGKPTMLFTFSAHTKRALAKASSSRLTLRTAVKDAKGRTVVYVRPLLLLR